MSFNREALFHWSLYGAKAQPSTQRVDGKEFTRTKPFSKPIVSPWEATISQNDIPKLLNGFKPADMDDKWIVYADGPDEKGDAVVHSKYKQKTMERQNNNIILRLP